MKCTRCTNEIPPLTGQEEFPSDALIVILTGGYGQFRDDMRSTNEDLTDAVLCHRCGHELLDFLTIPRSVWAGWHYKSNGIKVDPLCDGWSDEDEKQLQEQSTTVGFLGCETHMRPAARCWPDMPGECSVQWYDDAPNPHEISTD